MKVYEFLGHLTEGQYGMTILFVAARNLHEAKEIAEQKNTYEYKYEFNEIMKHIVYTKKTPKAIWESINIE